ncbi:MAG TPA: hypothetical protein VMP11_16300 [Verrucomicrobiae bacterium]|nr:hypothetical protein [Verrucomicrobiae bacterium]
MSDRLCEWPNCGRLAGPGWEVHGKYYCGPHYFPGLERAFVDEYARWDGVREPGDKFKNLFSRYVERLYPAGGMPEKMSQNRIELRATSWRKTEAGLEFSIERHQTTHRWAGPIKTVNQDWRFGLETKDLILLQQRDLAPRKLGMFSTVAKPRVPASSAVGH